MIVQLGTCELCGSKGVVRHSGFRWLCVLCWPVKASEEGEQ